jgi:DNA-binding transcriptional MocR family regulator
MQVMGRFRVPFDDREVAVTALRHGLELQPVSINFFADPPEHGLLLGFAGLDKADAELAVKMLRKTFKELEADGAARLVPAKG